MQRASGNQYFPSSLSATADRIVAGLDLFYDQFCYYTTYPLSFVGEPAREGVEDDLLQKAGEHPVNGSILVPNSNFREYQGFKGGLRFR